MQAIDIQFDDDFEKDGLYTVTFWLDANPPRYLNLTKDCFENSTEVYIELLDQKYGFETNDASYRLDENILTVYLTKNFSFLEGKDRIMIEIQSSDILQVSEKLTKIFLI